MKDDAKSCDTGAAPPSLRTTVRNAFVIGGAAALVIGLLIVIWPGKTATVLTTIVALYAVVTGIVHIGIGILAKAFSGWMRAGQIVAGAMFVLAALIALANPASGAPAFATITAVFIGISWIFEGFAALLTLSRARSRGWTIAHAAVSILGGVVLLVAPLVGAALVWIWVAVTLVAIGVAQIVRGIRA